MFVRTFDPLLIVPITPGRSPLHPVQLSEAEEDRSLWSEREGALVQKIEQNNEKIQQLEGYWLEAQGLCKTLNQHLTDSQSQHDALDKKYNKAKKLLKDYQQK